MRHWLFHPLLFYPLVALAAAFVIALSLQPQAWPRDPAPVEATRDGEWFVFQGEAFSTPAADAQQEMTVVRDFWGRARQLRIAKRGDAAEDENGVRILLAPEDAAALSGRPVIMEVSYNASAVNAASGLAVRLDGESSSGWVSQDAPPQPATLRFRLPAQNGVNAIALRAISTSDDQAYGIEITRIRVTPHT